MAHIDVNVKLRVSLFGNDPIDQGGKLIITSMETRLAVQGLMAKLTAMCDGREPYLDIDISLES